MYTKEISARHAATAFHKRNETCSHVLHETSTSQELDINLNNLKILILTMSNQDTPIFSFSSGKN